MNLAKAYTPNDYEPTIYAMWDKSGVFAPKGEGEPYAIVTAKIGRASCRERV